MRLTLVPPRSYPIPPSLQSHTLESPLRTFPARTPQSIAYRRGIVALHSLGISTCSTLAHDKAAWWAAAVSEVTWDLDADTLVVEMVDGSLETWTFDERGVVGLSDEFVDEDDEMEDDELASSQPAPASQPEPRDADGHSRLRALSVELRSAYEDVGTPSPDVLIAGSSTERLCAGSEYDFTPLTELAADPSLKFPWEWSNLSSRREWFHDEPDEPNVRRSKRRKSTSGMRPPQQGGDTKGQLTDHRRPTRADVAAASTSSTKAPDSRHDFLSLVALLTETRQTLLDLFSKSVILALKERLPPTYSIWAATAVEKWLLRSAVRKAGDLARIFDGLRSDTGDAFDLTDDESESGDFVADIRTGFVDEDDDEFDSTLGAFLDSSQGSINSRRGERLRRNIMWELRDDYALRNWCEAAKARAREVDRQADYGGDVLSEQPPPVWEISKPYSCSTPLKSKARVWELAASPPTTVDGSDDDEGDSDFNSIGADKTRFFYPVDPIDEGLLPKRLPKTLLEHAPGREMERTRRIVHELLNEVAGLQKKVAEIRVFVESELDGWEAACDLQHRQTRRKPTFAINAPASSPLGRPLPSTPPARPSPSPSPTQAGRFQPLRITVGHTAVGEPVGASKKRKSINTKGTDPAHKRKKENLARVRAASDAAAKGRSPLGGVVASKQPYGTAGMLLPPPSPSRPPSSRRRKIVAVDAKGDRPASPRPSLTRAPDLLQPLDLSNFQIPGTPQPPPKLEPIARRLLPSELAAQRSTVARDAEAHPFAIRHLPSPENILTYKEGDFGGAEDAADSFEDGADEPAAHEIDLDEPESESSGLLKSLFANLGASFTYVSPLASFAKSTAFVTSSIRADEPPPFGISPFQIHSPTPLRPPSPAFAIDPFLDALLSQPYGSG